MKGGKNIKSVSDYIKNLTPKEQKIAKIIRSCIKKAEPRAEEAISYQIPAYKYNGILVYFSIYKKHIGFYPTSSGVREFKKELTMYKTTKGTIQFPIEKPLPVGLITKIVKFRVKENLRKVLQSKK